MEDLKYIVSKNMINLRTLNRMTQFELGEKLNYSDKAISKWERAEAVPDAYILKQMSELFHVSVDYLLSDHSEEEKKAAFPQHNNYLTITKISVLGVWTLTLLVFIAFWILGRAQWLLFVYAVPVSLIVLLVLNSIWGNRRNNFYIISALVWGIIATVYLSFLQHNWWLLFSLGIPAQVIIYLCFKIRGKEN
ncbi:MAG: helix-turn-helix transcriptional regulator [Peptococcaceae bacterium]|nr:helix-turn-helix transcriptional regulator [Peptococcaceae bacterium]